MQVIINTSVLTMMAGPEMLLGKNCWIRDPTQEERRRLVLKAHVDT